MGGWCDGARELFSPPSEFTKVPAENPRLLVVGGAPFSPILESDKAVKLIASVRLQTNDARFAAWQQATAVRIG